jgi:hypothetical protein
MSLMDFVVSPPGCGRSVNDFWGWDAHEAQLRCPDEVDGDAWIWSTRRDLNLSSTKLPTQWSPWESSSSRKNPHVRPRNRTRDLMISSQKLWPLDHEADHICNIKFYNFRCTYPSLQSHNDEFTTVLHTGYNRRDVWLFYTTAHSVKIDQ